MSALWQVRASGASMVELLVALGVGVIVVLGLTEMLAASNATYAREEQLARIQENGRLSAMIAAKHIRESRSIDCKSIAMHQLQGSLVVEACALLDNNCTGDHFLSTDRALGYDGSVDLSQPANLIDLPPAVRENVADRWVRGDVFVAWGVSPEGIPLDGPLGDESGDIDGTGHINLSTSPIGLQLGDLALVSNCKYAHVFAISGPAAGDDDTATKVLAAGKIIEHGTANGGDAYNRTGNFRVSDVYAGAAPYNRHDSDPRALFYALFYKVFYVCCVYDGALQSTKKAIANCRAGDDDYRPGLCAFDIQDNGGRSQVLVPDLVDLRLTYSGDRDGDGHIDFRSEDQSPIPTAIWVSDNDAWHGVRSASVELLLTSTRPAHALITHSKPSRNTWPPSSGDVIHPDTLGASCPEDSRLFRRLRFEIALRATTPWNLSD
jgi:hypothetical protein